MFVFTSVIARAKRTSAILIFLKGTKDEAALQDWLDELVVENREDLAEKALEAWIAKQPSVKASEWQAPQSRSISIGLKPPPSGRWQDTPVPVEMPERREPTYGTMGKFLGY